MGMAIVEARRLALENQARSERLRHRGRCLAANAPLQHLLYEASRAEAHTRALRPFIALYGRLKRARLLPLKVLPHTASQPDSDVARQPVRVAAHGAAALLAGSVAGAGVGAAAYSAVGAVGTASTGTAVSGPSGAAAGSATLAWFGGGSAAAGGGGVAAGTTVLGAVVAAPPAIGAVGVSEAKGRQLLREQSEIALDPGP